MLVQRRWERSDRSASQSAVATQQPVILVPCRHQSNCLTSPSNGDMIPAITRKLARSDPRVRTGGSLAEQAAWEWSKWCQAVPLCQLEPGSQELLNSSHQPNVRPRSGRAREKTLRYLRAPAATSKAAIPLDRRRNCCFVMPVLPGLWQPDPALAIQLAYRCSDGHAYGHPN